MASLCGNGCGSYGLAEYGYFCYKCYIDFFMSLAENHGGCNRCKNCIYSEVVDQLPENRCKNCNREVGLTGFKCRCGNLFCDRHRLPEDHACTQDFKAAAARNKLDLVPIQENEEILDDMYLFISNMN